jgi:hypothetical protein
MRGEEMALGAREVVLRKLCDLLEETGALLVVEEPGRESLWSAGETAVNFNGNGVCRRWGEKRLAKWRERIRDRGGSRHYENSLPYNSAV